MATAKQPRDSAGAAIPVLRFRSGASQELTSVTSSTAQRSSAFSTGTQVITVTVTEPMYFATGDSSVAATSSSHYIPCLLYTSPSPRDVEESRMPSSA